MLLFDYTYQIRPDLRKDYHLQLTIQFGQNQIILRMESLIYNSGFDNITQKIFLLLDHETLITCRLVCQSLKTKVDDPYCWIKRCRKLGQPKSLTDSWTNLVHIIKKTWLRKDIKVEAENHQDQKILWLLRKMSLKGLIEQKFLQCLMKWTYALQFLTHLELCLNGYSPLHFAAYYDCLEVVEFITLCKKMSISKIT